MYDRYSPRMYRFFFRMLWRDAGKAEDFTQEIFLKIIEKPQLFDPERNFKTWIYTLASNLCKNEYRRPPPPEMSWEEPVLGRFIAREDRQSIVRPTSSAQHRRVGGGPQTVFYIALPGGIIRGRNSRNRRLSGRNCKVETVSCIKAGGSANGRMEK